MTQHKKGVKITPFKEEVKEIKLTEANYKGNPTKEKYPKDCYQTNRLRMKKKRKEKRKMGEERSSRKGKTVLSRKCKQRNRHIDVRFYP